MLHCCQQSLNIDSRHTSIHVHHSRCNELRGPAASSNVDSSMTLDTSTVLTQQTHACSSSACMRLLHATACITVSDVCTCTAYIDAATTANVCKPMHTTSKTTSQCSYDGHTAWHVVCTLISIPAQGALPAMTHTAPNTSLILAAHVTTIVMSPVNGTTHTYSSLLKAAATHTSKHSATASCAHVGKAQKHPVAHQLHAACSNSAAEHASGGRTGTPTLQSSGSRSNGSGSSTTSYSHIAVDLNKIGQTCYL